MVLGATEKPCAVDPSIRGGAKRAWSRSHGPADPGLLTTAPTSSTSIRIGRVLERDNESTGRQGLPFGMGVGANPPCLQHRLNCSGLGHLA